jgi:hypothetical protein
VAPLIADRGLVQVQVAGPQTAGPLLSLAVSDMRSALQSITGAAQAPTTSSLPYAIVAVVNAEEEAALGAEGYRLQTGPVPDGRPGITVTGATEAGAAYGLYHVLGDLGVLYYHPEAKYLPPPATRRLPWSYDNEVHTPDFALRGFHEHTQHPIPMSEYYLKAGREDYRAGASRYLQWLARNRQNTATFHMLKTVDLDSWLPYITDIAAEAESLNVKLGVVLSFVDQQQNNFKLYDEAAPVPAAEQIQTNLDKLLAAGFRSVTIQIGSSEFTKPADTDVLTWLATAVSHMAKFWPDVRPYAWIHITCDLKADAGGYFFHLPLLSTEALGVWVHTVMYYPLDHPAPVYECENFAHQKAFLAAADGKREQVWFPETSWWLGFDNNAPVVLPITGWAREYDIVTGLDKRQVNGHVTFTTGREWTYWQYDHFLTRSTWDKEFSWSDYLEWIAPAYGPLGEQVVKATLDWTELQKRHFLEENPDIYFYIAGELPQDEIGKQAGVYARPPKPAFGDIYGLADEAFAAWRAKDFDMLVRMRGEYSAALEGLPAEAPSGTDTQKALYEEFIRAYTVTLRRVEHTIALYNGVIAARAGDETAAREKLEQAKAITAEVQTDLVAMEELYRDPVELLARPLPESLTSYPYGYLEQTSTGYFWTRRDAQLEGLIDLVFGGGEESWTAVTDAVYTAQSGSVTLTEPADPIAGPIIAAFIPPLLFGVEVSTGGEGKPSFVLHAGEDTNNNLLPDPQTEQVFSGELESNVWTSEGDSYVVLLRDDTGALLRELEMKSPKWTVQTSGPADPLPLLQKATLAARIVSADLVDTIMQVGGIDEEGASGLIKSVYALPAGEALPLELPLTFEIALTPAASR